MSTTGPIEETQAFCTCIFEPRGQSGLEGYSRGDIYKYEYFEKDVSGRPYYRVYPLSGDNYYETCSVAVFNRFFKVVESDAKEKA